MSRAVRSLLVLIAVLLPVPLLGQEAAVEGTWKVDARTDTRGGPREVIIRADSSATWGKETSRWRLKDDSIMVAIGGEWETYKLDVSKTRLTISGGDLQKPISLKRVGPATPRPAGVSVPPDPDA
ncbi:MAG TPA: hypothetical protein VFL88_00635 [Gemmatimonadales bacterium]|jgi:hypothetical protein|nr:hypothetical protein [Gemmatimonadales bacterium]